MASTFLFSTLTELNLSCSCSKEKEKSRSCFSSPIIFYIPVYYDFLVQLSFLFLYIMIFLLHYIFYSYISWLSCQIIFFIPIYYDYLFQLSFYEWRSIISGPRTNNTYFTFHIKGAFIYLFIYLFCVPNVVITKLFN